MVVHTQEKNYQCTECGKAFGRKGDLKKHMFATQEPEDSSVLFAVSSIPTVKVSSTI